MDKKEIIVRFINKNLNCLNEDLAFTLIEILAVVAIISILAVIGVVNFIEYTARAKVARTKADLLSLSTALEAYAVDNNSQYPYPQCAIRNGIGSEMNGFIGSVAELTTPVAYLTSVMLVDPFDPDWASYSVSAQAPPKWKPTYMYYNYSGWYLNTLPSEIQKVVIPFRGFCLNSTGPDRNIDSAQMVPIFIDNPNIDQQKMMKTFINLIYDPTNGTYSTGDIIQWTYKPQLYGNF